MVECEGRRGLVVHMGPEAAKSLHEKRERESVV